MVRVLWIVDFDKEPQSGWSKGFLQKKDGRYPRDWYSISLRDDCMRTLFHPHTGRDESFKDIMEEVYARGGEIWEYSPGALRFEKWSRENPRLFKAYMKNQ